MVRSVYGTLKQIFETVFAQSSRSFGEVVLVEWPRKGTWSVAFVTGHENPDKPETALDWPALAAFPGTLVFYMGVKALPRIASQLIAGRRPPTQPVAVVEQGTLPGQNTVVSTLGEIGSVTGIRAPAITLVDDVAALREQIAWLETRPLHGRTVAVTRARAQASALAARLCALGAAVVEAPAIRTRSPLW